MTEAYQYGGTNAEGELESLLFSGKSETQIMQAITKNVETTDHCAASSGVGIASPEQMKTTGWFDAGNYYLAIAEKSYLHANNLALPGISGGGLLTLASTIVNTQGFPKGGVWNSFADAVNAYINADSVTYFTSPDAPTWMSQSQWPASSNQGAEYIIMAINSAMSQWNNAYEYLQGDYSSSSSSNSKVKKYAQ